MPKPEIAGTGPNLKKSGTSKFWIVGSNIAKGDKVEVKVGEEVWWTGSIKKCKDGKCRAEVTYSRSTPLQADEGDLETVAITVNNGEPSDAHEDQGVVDGPE